jgi:hypothetical protein
MFKIALQKMWEWLKSSLSRLRGQESRTFVMPALLPKKSVQQNRPTKLKHCLHAEHFGAFCPIIPFARTSKRRKYESAKR